MQKWRGRKWVKYWSKEFILYTIFWMLTVSSKHLLEGFILNCVVEIKDLLLIISGLSLLERKDDIFEDWRNKFLNTYTVSILMIWNVYIKLGKFWLSQCLKLHFMVSCRQGSCSGPLHRWSIVNYFSPKTTTRHSFFLFCIMSCINAKHHLPFNNTVGVLLHNSITPVFQIQHLMLFLFSVTLFLLHKPLSLGLMHNAWLNKYYKTNCRVVPENKSK